TIVEQSAAAVTYLLVFPIMSLLTFYNYTKKYRIVSEYTILFRIGHMRLCIFNIVKGVFFLQEQPFSLTSL
ncbi:hypothetical protein, partial [Bacillus paranthracis]|uniref:hypothetical protein n=1 Tax=Bacillus paranthracis TaxID=2026186 RepID=UPI002852E332